VVIGGINPGEPGSLIMFMGSFPHTIDTKGRVSIPKDFRAQLAGSGDNLEFVITWGMSGHCLWAYPRETWEEMLSKIRNSKPSTSKDAFVRTFVGGAHPCGVDRLGRVLVPPILRDGVGLTKNVVVVGAIEKIEIWDADRFQADRQSEASLSRARAYYDSDDFHLQ